MTRWTASPCASPPANFEELPLLISRLRGHRVVVPGDLGSVTRIDHAAETPAAALGLDSVAVESVWQAVERFYGSGLHPGITLAVRYRGQLVLKRAIGRSPDGEVLEPDAPLCLFSASKAISALLVHRLVADGAISLDDRVADYIPEFSPHGKHRVTIRQLLAHRAGVPTIAVEHRGPELLRDWDRLLDLLCAAKPSDLRFETQAYHPLTGGFIIGELVQRVSGLSLRDALQQWISEPLGLQQMRYGLGPEQRHCVPLNTVTGMAPIWPLSRYIEGIIGLPLAEGVAATNDDAFLSSVVPAGNMHASADEVSRVFQMLLDGGAYQGRQILPEAVVREAVQPVDRIRFDRTILMPMRFSPGFMLGERPYGLYGPNCPAAFGHLGFLNVLGWADPQRGISAALLNTGKSLAPSGFLKMFAVLNAIARAFPSSRRC
jgi:CubicO group peptidase (beta-lactamase class C family)